MSAPVTVSVIGRKIATLEHPWSTMVTIVLCPLVVGSPMIKSMATCRKGRPRSGTRILYSDVLGQWV